MGTFGLSPSLLSSMSSCSGDEQGICLELPSRLGRSFLKVVDWLDESGALPPPQLKLLAVIALLSADRKVLLLEVVLWQVLALRGGRLGPVFRPYHVRRD